MHVTIEIEGRGDAFADDAGWEVARILRELAERVTNNLDLNADGVAVPLRDVNGNTCGAWMVTP